jgi:hypothetical protein
MRPSPTEQTLLDAFAEFEIIDCHEHLSPEHWRTSRKVDALTLFSHYTRTDLITAGMAPADYDRMLDPDLPLDMRWGILRPFLPHVRFGSYARPAFIAARDIYGFEDISDDTYQPLSEAMQAANTPGIYHRILRERCKIRTALTQAGRTDYDDDLLTPLMPVDTYAGISKWEQVADNARALGMTVRCLDDYLDVIRAGIVKWKSERVVGLKTISNTFATAERGQAHALFETLRTGAQDSLPDMKPLRDFLKEFIYDVCAEEDLVVAVHAGMWGDFREMDPTLIMPVMMRHPKTRFDLYHLGMPNVRECAVMGKNMPNVWLNLCWTHIISPKMLRSALDEVIDMVPINKILAFGGDYGLPVEKVWGHLVMARENIAHVLGGRVDDRLMTIQQAVEVARRWFWENPRELYRVGAEIGA